MAVVTRHSFVHCAACEGVKRRKSFNDVLVSVQHTA